MTIVNDRLNANKPPPPAPDPKKITPSQINNNKDLDVDSNKEEPSFFGSFFQGKKATKKGPNAPVMESVRSSDISCGLALKEVDIDTCYHSATGGS